MRPWIAAVLLTAAAAPTTTEFRFSRPVEAPAGWCALDLPDDVLDACRPGLPDLRLRNARDEEVPYAFAEETGQELRRADLTNVESSPKRETQALLDRGPQPPLARSVILEIRGDDFLKPVSIEASSDGVSFREFARGSVFAAPRVRSTTLHFPPNDRRYWRFRFDDRNSDPVGIGAVRVEAAGSPVSLREIPVPIESMRSEGSVLLRARLPAANLSLRALRLTIGEPAFRRRARVFERVLFRDEVFRRLLGETTLERSPDSAGNTEIAVCDPAGRNLEIEIVDDDSPPLHVSGLTAIARSRRLLFFSPGAAPHALFYGSPSAPAPHYDLSAAMRRGVPKSAESAALGEPRSAGAPVSLPIVARGAPLETSAWATRQAIETPGSGEVAYVDLTDKLSRQLSALRIVDLERRPVPHIVEGSLRKSVIAVRLLVAQRGSRTLGSVLGLDPSRPPDALTLFASGPEYFSREVTVFAADREGHRRAADSFLGSSPWERGPGQPARPVTVSLAPTDARALEIEIENGENAPLAIDRAEIQVPYVRIDFVFRPGEKLALLSDNPAASSPRYDLALVADRVLASPAQPARLGPAEEQKTSQLPRWFWAAVVVSAILVAAALLRTLKTLGP